MGISKWAWLIIGNSALGLFTCYLTIFLWLLTTSNQEKPFFSWIGLLSLIIGAIIFIVWNYFTIKNYTKKYWLHSAVTYFATISIFVLLFHYL